MNDIAKQVTADKFLLALKKEHLSKKEAGEYVGLTPAQVSCLFNKHFWDKVGVASWDKVLTWVNSGQGLQEYGKKHGKVVVEKQEDTNPKTVEDVMDNVAKSAERHIKRAEKKKTISYKPGITDRIKPIPKEEKDATKRVRNEMIEGKWPYDQKYGINLAELGWIIGYLRSGKSVERVSKELKIYSEIVKMISENMHYVPEKSDDKAENIKTVDLENGFGKTTIIKANSPEKRLTTGQLIDLLIEEKKSLQEKIAAIEVLLKHYIS